MLGGSASGRGGVSVAREAEHVQDVEELAVALLHELAEAPWADGVGDSSDEHVLHGRGEIRPAQALHQPVSARPR